DEVGFPYTEMARAAIHRRRSERALAARDAGLRRRHGKETRMAKAKPRWRRQGARWGGADVLDAHGERRGRPARLARAGERQARGLRRRGEEAAPPALERAKGRGRPEGGRDARAREAAGQ